MGRSTYKRRPSNDPSSQRKKARARPGDAEASGASGSEEDHRHMRFRQPGWSKLGTDTANEYRSREAFHHIDRVSHPRSLMGYLTERSPFFRAERIREKKKLGAHQLIRPKIKQPQSHSKSKSKSHRVVSHQMIRYPRPRPKTMTSRIRKCGSERANLH